jgi:quinolinate synthase
LKFAIKDEATEFIVATESGILHEMTKACPEKLFLPAPPETTEGIGCSCNECEFMKLNTLKKLYNTLKYEWPTIEVDPEIAEKAVGSINRMLEISQTLPSPSL